MEYRVGDLIHKYSTYVGWMDKIRAYTYAASFFTGRTVTFWHTAPDLSNARFAERFRWDLTRLEHVLSGWAPDSAVELFEYTASNTTYIVYGADAR